MTVVAPKPPQPFPSQPVPPPLVSQPVAVSPQPSPPVAMNMPAHPPAEAVAQPPPSAPQAGIQLGFADGTNVALDPSDPQAIALKKVADVLVSTQPGPRRLWARKPKR